MVCLQECQHTNAKRFNDCGWEIHYSTDRRAAVAWYGGFSRDVIAKREGYRYASVEFAGLVCTSVYLPCAQTDTDHVAEYLEVLVKVSMSMHMCQQTVTTRPRTTKITYRIVRNRLFWGFYPGVPVPRSPCIPANTPVPVPRGAPTNIPWGFRGI